MSDTPLLLMTPGPTRVPPPVLEAGALPMIHHRTERFSRTVAAVVEGLRPVFGTTSGDVLPIHTTGRGAMEAALTNLLSPGDEIICCCNGKFGELWAEIAGAYGVTAHRISTAWERSVDPAEVERALGDHPNAKAVTLAHGDTSTGVLNDVAAVLRVLRERAVLGLVDSISVLGGAPCEFDTWGADIVVTASQKCLMSSAGLAFVAVSERAWAAQARARLPRSYWDFAAARKTLAKSPPETPGSAPVHLFLQVEAALALMHAEGLAAVYARHESNARQLRQGAAQLGLSILCPALDCQSPTLTALRVPDGVTAKAIKAGMKARGILVAGGLGKFGDSAFRIGHMGDIRQADIALTCAALGEVLADLGVKPPLAVSGA